MIVAGGAALLIGGFGGGVPYAFVGAGALFVCALWMQMLTRWFDHNPGGRTQPRGVPSPPSASEPAVRKAATSQRRRMIVLGLVGYVIVIVGASIAVGLARHRFLAGLTVWCAGGVLAILVGVSTMAWGVKTGHLRTDAPPDRRSD